jgi:hypothetical protein
MDEKLEIALKEYELATHHYLHEDKMKTDALRNSIIAVITIMSITTTIIASEYIKNIQIKLWFSIIMGLSGILISFCYGVQYRRILRYQEAREARLEELEKIIEETNHFAPRTIRYGLELMDRKKLHIPENYFKPCIRMGILESWSSNIWFKMLIPWFLIILWIIFLVVVVRELLFYSF